MPAGRPSKYKPEFVDRVARLCAIGLTDREIAEILEVSEVTLNAWKHEHPEFLKSLKLAKDEADERVEKSLYRRALGYSHDAVKITVNAAGEETITPYVEHYPPDTTACIFWLKNRKQADWRDRQQVEHIVSVSERMRGILNAGDTE